MILNRQKCLKINSFSLALPFVSATTKCSAKLKSLSSFWSKVSMKNSIEFVNTTELNFGLHENSFSLMQTASRSDFSLMMTSRTISRSASNSLAIVKILKKPWGVKTLSIISLSAGMIFGKPPATAMTKAKNIETLRKFILKASPPGYWLRRFFTFYFKEVLLRTLWVFLWFFAIIKVHSCQIAWIDDNELQYISNHELLQRQPSIWKFCCNPKKIDTKIFNFCFYPKSPSKTSKKSFKSSQVLAISSRKIKRCLRHHKSSQLSEVSTFWSWQLKAFWIESCCMSAHFVMKLSGIAKSISTYHQITTVWSSW